MKEDLRTLSVSDLENVLSQWNEKKFRAKQILSWLWYSKASTIDEMSNLSKKLREKLREKFEIRPVKVQLHQKSGDGTIKFIFELYDNLKVEGVMIPQGDRYTACISSQVGCSLSCTFCATGQMKRERNLTAGEIYDQVVLISNHVEEVYNANLTNIVYMGMGEPLLNYVEVMKSINYLTDEQYLNIGSKRITVSTAGIVKMIRQLAIDNPKINLALSLHAPTDSKRSKMMAINDSNTLSQLVDALQYYYQETNKKVTFEYIAFHRFNDTIEDAKDLLYITQQVPCKINIIEYNHVKGVEFEKSSAERLNTFASFLANENVNVQIRLSRGKDIDAACGQLALDNQEN